jgi:TfoX/Sxy family transcriptional regulator of competence genes
MPGFEKSPPELVARFAELAEQVPEAARKQMFGYPTCVLNGNMFMGLHQDRVFLRLDEADQERFRSELGGEPFEPMPGRPMRGYMVVPPAMLDDPALSEWIGRSFAFASSLPPKKPKAAKKS